MPAAWRYIPMTAKQSPAEPRFIDEAEYSTRIVGDWQGTEGGSKETISFYADGDFECHLRASGFISMALAQGGTGRIHGTWRMDGKSITLHISGAQDERVLYRIATITIEIFRINELKVKSATGVTSTFLRRQMY